MTVLEIALIIIGVVFFAGSFFISEKLSSSDIQDLSKASEKEIQTMIESSLKKNEDMIDSRIEEKLDRAYNEYDVKTDKETSEKIFQISEYSDNVLKSVSNSHDELIFIYDRMNEKQQKLVTLTTEIDEMYSALTALKAEVEADIERLDEKTKEAYQQKMEENFSVGISAEVIGEEPRTIEPVTEVTEAIEAHMQKNQSDSPANSNDRILELHSKGYSEVEIAKELGRGLGEVKLVLGLFEGEPS